MRKVSFRGRDDDDEGAMLPVRGWRCDCALERGSSKSLRSAGLLC